MTAVDKMLNELREAVREAREEKESAEAYYAVLQTALSDIAGHVDPRLVNVGLRAQILGAQRALDIINGIGKSK